MTNDIQDGVTVRRKIYFPRELAQRLDSLVARGAMYSNIIAVCLLRSLPNIEKQFEAGKTAGLKVRKTK